MLPTIIVATSGGAGEISAPALATRENLAEVREEEERRALAAIGSNATLHFLRYEDGGLDRVSIEELIEVLAPLLVEARPHVVVTFGPEGVTKHPDHVRVHEAGTRAFHEARATSEGPAFQRLLYSVIGASEMDWRWERLAERGVEVEDRDAVYVPRGVPDETIAVRVDCDEMFERKLAALEAHRTQSHDLHSIPQELRRRFLSYECFVQAWPGRPPGAPVLADPFQGIAPD